MSDTVVTKDRKDSGVELRDEGLRHVVGVMPRALFVWSAVTLAAGIAVIVAAVRILL